MICFPRKICLSIPAICAIQPRDQGGEKIGSLKYFEICGIREEELPVNKSTYSSSHQSNCHGHLSKADGEILIHLLIELSKLVLDRH
jgi:hypothetical protein